MENKDRKINYMEKGIIKELPLGTALRNTFIESFFRMY